MAGELVIAHFSDREAAQRAAAGLQQAGINPGDVEIRPGERGAALVCVLREVDDAEADRIALILESHHPQSIETKPNESADESTVGRTTTLSGAPADHGISAGTVPQAEPDTDWLVRREGELAAEFDPDPEPNQP
jgi:hypothetical protein